MRAVVVSGEEFLQPVGDKKNGVISTDDPALYAPASVVVSPWRPARPSRSRAWVLARFQEAISPAPWLARLAGHCNDGRLCQGADRLGLHRQASPMSLEERFEPCDVPWIWPDGFPDAAGDPLIQKVGQRLGEVLSVGISGQ